MPKRNTTHSQNHPPWKRNLHLILATRMRIVQSRQETPPVNSNDNQSSIAPTLLENNVNQCGERGFWEAKAWASCQIRKIVGCACAGNAGNVFPATWVSDPDMHHGMCVTRVPWWMPRSLTSGFLWRWWWGKLSRHSRCMCNPQFYVSGKRPMIVIQCGTVIILWVQGLT